ncbi:hypothetical protein [Candidatus Nitrosocosmicus sp. T]
MIVETKWYNTTGNKGYKEGLFDRRGSSSVFLTIDYDKFIRSKLKECTDYPDKRQFIIYRRV